MEERKEVGNPGKDGEGEVLRMEKNSREEGKGRRR